MGRKKRTFGVEIECGKGADKFSKFARANSFACVIDQSLIYDDSREFRSKIFRYKKDFENIKTLLSTLAIHVHVGASDYTKLDIADLGMMGVYWDAVMWTFAAEHRYDWYNKIFKVPQPKALISEYADKKLSKLSTISCITDCDRGFGLNIYAWNKARKTIEFRYFDTHYDYDLLEAQIELCRNIIDYTKRHGAMRPLPSLGVKFSGKAKGKDADKIRAWFLRNIGLQPEHAKTLRNYARNRTIVFHDPFEFCHDNY